MRNETENASAGAWPVLRRYQGGNLRRVALPLGGIGTGTVSLGGRGDLRDWEIMNRPAKGFTPARGFFAIRFDGIGDEPVLRALEGRIDPADYEGPHGSRVPNHGLARFASATFETAYPLATVRLEDPEIEPAVRLEAFNPLVPVDPEASGYPAAVLRYVVHNPYDHPIDVTVCGSVPNIVGYDGSVGSYRENRNTVRKESRPGYAITGVLCGSDRDDTGIEQYGTLALSALHDDDTGNGLGNDQADVVTTRTNWAERSWGGGLLDFWDDLLADGRLEERTSDRAAPTGSVAVHRTVPAGASTSFTFLLTWHFANRPAWWIDDDAPNPWQHTDLIVGNHYATRWPDAWAVALELADQLPALESATVDFVRTFCGTDLPPVIAEAALSNLGTVRTQTCFRTADGNFFGWEGCDDHIGSCPGSCTHVWNYEPATAHLFGSLARSMREVEFGYATDERGLMSFRVMLPLAERAQLWRLAAADGQMGCIVKLHREWLRSGDEEFLRGLWPNAKRALEFCWIPGGWDADQDGVMEGCQHNTMDVEYYGPNPQMGVWYLAALRAAEEMARHLGDVEFAERCRGLFENGSRWLDEHLFTGSYYRHEIRPPENADAIAEGLRHYKMGARDLADPELQLGDGCLIDQLVGQVLAHQSGMGYLLDPDNVATTWDSVLRLNRREGFDGHFNPMRSYVLGDEVALTMCSYTEGERPARPFPYAAEVMTGFEYTAAVGLAYEGKVAEAVRVVEDIRARYDGRRRNPFDEAECGHHYARAMASWGMVLALTGFGYEGTTGVLRLRGRDGARDFWSTGDAWGVAEQRHQDGTLRTEITVHGGRLTLSRIDLTGLGPCAPEGLDATGQVRLSAGDQAVATGTAIPVG